MTVEILQGDCREVLKTLPEKSVQTVITSPPYWGLRDYGTATWEGGEAACEHKERTARNDGGRTGVNGFHGSTRDDSDKGAMNYRGQCPCGAVRQDVQLGLEPTPEQYVENIVAVFREVRRVLRDDGTLWLNLGDSFYAGGGNYSGGNVQRDANGVVVSAFVGRDKFDARPDRPSPKRADLKPKDLVGIPWRVAFALQADGWWLRSDIIWAKPNPMPESVTDRPTRSHEYVFLLSKSARYYYDADAIREDYAESSVARVSQANFKNQTGGPKDYRNGTNGNRSARQALENLAENTGAGRNKRTVWEIPTQPYSEAHFATFPEALVKPCIQAGTSERGQCAECGKPWERVVETTRPPTRETVSAGPAGEHGTLGTKRWDEPIKTTTTGWRPTCTHEADTVPQIVLDCFGGSGTVGVVAKRAGRRAILIDASEAYCELARKRIGAQGVLL